MPGFLVDLLLVFIVMISKKSRCPKTRMVIILCDMKVKFVLPMGRNRCSKLQYLLSVFTSESIFIIISDEVASGYVSETNLSEDCSGLSSQSDILTTQVKSMCGCVLLVSSAFSNMHSAFLHLLISSFRINGVTVVCGTLSPQIRL